ncbi:glycoprotein integral membrane protein 1 [Lampris incognitus]|uniref:glycoprotein integral membrane protein 1 n=1 Tax=Lampris incognitus TaxID=2546036 RepID=UPI0024B61DFB|nr:glycoprotein integral membrane protein 1 [Lampris incognitus]XP_056150050.1 glycoprotein integral membrane protein 1 [Lampris incognitus]
MSGVVIYAVSLFLVSVACADSLPQQPNTENILINVTAGTFGDSQLQESNDLQINLNISVDEEQVRVNDIPVEPSGVTRLNCQALLLLTTNGSSEFASGDLVSTVTRVMVSQNRLYSDTEEVVAVQVFSEVIEMEGKEVQQPDMCEVKILMSPNFQKLAQYTNIYPIGHSEIFRIPRENDVVITGPPSPKKAEDHVISQTTSQYPLKHAETTQEEVAAPGKLPETPLRMDPNLLYDGRDEEDNEVKALGQGHQIQTGTAPKESLSSYSAMCRWVEKMRERLRRFCSESLPLFFLVMWVVMIGVVGSAVIVKILDMFFPTCEHKGPFYLNPVTLMPEDEKHTLLEGIEVEASEEEDKKP